MATYFLAQQLLEHGSLGVLTSFAADSPQQSQAPPSQQTPSAQQSLQQQSSGRHALHTQLAHSQGDLLLTADARSVAQQLVAVEQHPLETIAIFWQDDPCEFDPM